MIFYFTSFHIILQSPSPILNFYLPPPYQTKLPQTSPPTFKPFLIINCQNPFHLMRHIGPFLALEDNGTRLQGFHSVPDILSYVHAVAAFRWVEDHVVDDGAVVVVSDDTYPASQHNKCLLFLRMAMDGDVGTRFHGIQKTVALLIQTLMKVKIHPQPGRCLGLGGQAVKYLVVYNHVGLPLILYHTIGKNKNFSSSVTFSLKNLSSLR